MSVVTNCCAALARPLPAIPSSASVITVSNPISDCDRKRYRLPVNHARLDRPDEGTGLTHFPISVSPSRMGRPKLDVKPMMVRLPEGMAERIDTIAGGDGRRAEFIRDAVERELKRREKLASKAASKA
jgi:hypothetical protein